MVKHILDLLQTKTRDLGVEEVCIRSLALDRNLTGKMSNSQISTQPIPQIAA
jgi:hypothetical protein